MDDRHYRYLFTDEGFRHAREKMAEVGWYRHRASISESFGGIKSNGLQPRRPAEAFPPAMIRTALAPGDGSIVCLFPAVGLIDQVRPPKRGSLFMIAVAGADLPPRVGIDWSFGNIWSLFDDLVVNYTHSPIEALHRASTRYGSLACYDPLPPNVLRVRTAGCSEHDYGRWPSILDVEVKDLYEEPTGDF